LTVFSFGRRPSGFSSPMTSGADGTSEISPPMNIPPFAPLSVPATTLAVTWTWPRLISEIFSRNPRLSARTSFFYLEPRGKLLKPFLGQDIFYQGEHLAFLEADVLLQCFSDTLQCLRTNTLACYLVTSSLRSMMRLRMRACWASINTTDSSSGSPP
jgi:hypothetical protein